MCCRSTPAAKAWSGRYEPAEEKRAFNDLFRDLFAGIRLALNDTQDTAVLAGVGYDLDTSETYVNIEADRRLGDDYVLELRARLFTNAESDDTSYAIENDDYLQLQLSRYF